MAAFPMATGLRGALSEPMDEFTSDLVAARVTIGQLGRWAQRYVQLHGVAERPGCCTGSPHCALADVPGGREACRLAVELARLPLTDGRGHVGRVTESRPEELALWYLRALRGATDAVSYCQRVQHLLGDCWFSTPEGPGDALCARTLAVAQLLGSTRRGFL